MVCADQYMMCNPTTSSCTPFGGWLELNDIYSKNSLGFNLEQMVTAGRLIIALIDSSTYESVANLGAAALWANNLIALNVSPGLPDNQWQAEVLGWFQTSLAKLQAYVVDYASNSVGLSQFGTVESSFSNRTNLVQNQVLESQCANQLVQTTGDIQNFTFMGVILIVCFSVFLVLLDWSLGMIIDLASRRVRSASVLKETREVDEKLHLLAAARGSRATGGTDWEREAWAITVLDPTLQFGRLSNQFTVIEESNGEKA